MILDKETMFSEEQAITADAVSTNVIDLEALGGTGDAGKSLIPIFAIVTEAFNTLTSLTVTVQTDSAVGFGTVEERQSVTVALADLAIGDKINLGCLTEGMLRYVRLDYDVTGTDPTTGAITAGLVLDIFSNQ